MSRMSIHRAIQLRGLLTIRGHARRDSFACGGLDDSGDDGVDNGDDGVVMLRFVMLHTRHCSFCFAVLDIAVSLRSDIG